MDFIKTVPENAEGVLVWCFAGEHAGHYEEPAEREGYCNVNTFRGDGCIL